MADRSEGKGRIVVGVDGSEPSERALRWAVRQAELTGGAVLAVIAWEYPTYHGARGWFPPAATDEAALEGRARQEAERAVREAVGDDPPVEVRTEARYGSPAGSLVEASRGADLLVVGSRGLGGFAGMLLGSVAQHCTRHATVPVVVVRDPQE
ncbi:universal stress protein [Kitasatospora sp. NPDC036755]|uniref:universal stress protein n=1 Tax=Kitasatospora sp. NPDC036755 TaxID=3154600 RepID=UPI00340CC7D6